MFIKRSYEKEIMDDFSITDERIDKALKELNVINKYLGGKNVTKIGIKNLAKGKSNCLKILDIGGGSSDNLYFIKDSSVKIFNVDLNIRACKFVNKSDNSFNVICANALRLPVKIKQIDISHTSLFLHHFKENEITNILNSLKQISKIGIVINDLRRTVFAFWGIKLLTSVFSKSDMVKNDAPLSVKKGFLKSEIKDILIKCGFYKFKIKRKWAFRWLIIIYL